MTYDDEKQFLRTILASITAAETTEQEVAAYDTLARFITHSQHVIEHQNLARALKRHIDDMLEMPDLPTYAREHGDAALARLLTVV